MNNKPLDKPSPTPPNTPATPPAASTEPPKPNILPLITEPIPPELMPKPLAPKPDSSTLSTLIPSPKSTTGASPAPAHTHKCAVCGHVNRAGILVCENCGTNLATGREATIGTKDIGQAKLDDTQEFVVNSAGSARFEDNMMLRLEIEGAPTPIVIFPKLETSLGRRDPGTGSAPDIDLTAYAGYRKGVSRYHAMLRLKDKKLEIYDLGSSNGTLVNGVRLSAHQPHPLRDGDMIMLGKMIIRVLFQLRSRTRNLP